VGVAADEDDESRLSEDGGPRTAQRAAAAPRSQTTNRPAGQTAQRRTAGARPLLPGEDVDPDRVGQDQHKHMHALWRELGAGGDEHRDFRLRKTAEWLGLEELSTSADLTRAQADVVIERLRERKKEKGGAA